MEADHLVENISSTTSLVLVNKIVYMYLLMFWANASGQLAKVSVVGFLTLLGRSGCP